MSATFPLHNRRTFLRHAAAAAPTLVLTAGSATWANEPHESGDAQFTVKTTSASQATNGFRVGLLTDVHHADKPPAGTRFYRQSAGKLAEAAQEFKKKSIDMLVELGDLIDAADSVETEQRYLQQISLPFSKICDDRHYVLGNHCVDTLTKKEFLSAVGKQKSYYSFDRGGFHFIVLDSCFRSDGKPYQRKNFHWQDANVPDAELHWLRDDLRNTALPTIVLAHQRLDPTEHHTVKNAAAVRTVLQNSQQVIAVLQGHSHQNALKTVKGIHYCTLAAMIEGSGPQNNGYATMTLTKDATIRIRGFRRQANYGWARPSPAASKAS